MLVKHISKGTPQSLDFQKGPLSDFIWLRTSRLCLLGHKIITNPLWDILASGVAVY